MITVPTMTTLSHSPEIQQIRDYRAITISESFHNLTI